MKELIRLATVPLISFILLYQVEALALLEIRGAVTLQSVEPSDLNQRHRDFNAPMTDSLLGFGIDALVHLPGVPIGFGVRYESFQSNKSAGSGTNAEYSYETGFSRIALLVNRRFIDTVWYLGPIAGVGITNSVWYDFRSASTSDSFRTVGGTSVSLGLESGLRLRRLLLGIEAGYMFAEFKVPKNASRAELTSTEGRVGLDFTGPYAKILVGYELL